MGKLWDIFIPTLGIIWDIFDLKMGLVALSQFWEFPAKTQQNLKKNTILSQNWESEIFPVIDQR